MLCPYCVYCVYGVYCAHCVYDHCKIVYAAAHNTTVTCNPPPHHPPTPLTHSHLIHRDYEAIVQDFVTLDFIPEGTDLTPILPVLAKVCYIDKDV